MTTRARFPKAFAGFVLAAVLPLACGNLIDFSDRPLTDNPPVKQDAGAPPDDAGANDDAGSDAPPVTCRAVTVDPAVDYEAMCRHYCDTLDETLRYLSLAQGRAPAPVGTTSQMCYELRCVPRCVDQALCFTQCEAAGTQYSAVCGTAEIAPDTVCPLSLEDHAAACRAGCGPVPN